MRKLIILIVAAMGLFAVAACSPIKSPAPDPVRVSQWYTYVYNETGVEQPYTTDCVDQDGNHAAYSGTLAADATQWEYYNWTYGVEQDRDTGAVEESGPVMAQPATCTTTFTASGPHTYENFTPADEAHAGPWEDAGPSPSPLTCTFPHVTGGSPGPYGSENVYWQCATKVT